MTQESYFFSQHGHQSHRHSYIPDHKYEEIPRGILRRTVTAHPETDKNKFRRKLSYAADTFQQPNLQPLLTY